jgi:hypothetical protein
LPVVIHSGRLHEDESGDLMEIYDPAWGHPRGASIGVR